MLINIIIITIFLLLVLICILPFEVSVILFKLLLLNMQIVLYWFHYFFSKNNRIITSFLEYFGVKQSSDVHTPIIEINFKDEEINLIVKNTNSTDIIDQFNFSFVADKIMELFCSYDYWFFLPICLYLFIIYFLHALLGLYSAYVDYFQKNPDHFQSMRGFLPSVFIFYFLIFICTVIIFYCFTLYLYNIIWFLFI
jgi:hypothetical protein